MTEPQDLVGLLAGMRAGDREAREALFDRFYGRVRDLVHRQLQHDFRKNNRWILPLFSTGDVVQEVFLSVVDHQLDGFVGTSEEDFVQYLNAIIKHRLIDAVRYHEASRRDARRQLDQPTTEERPSVQPAAEDATPSLAASLGEQLSVYEGVLASLSEKERQLVRRRMEEEEPFADIAEALDIGSADAARQAFRSAKARLLVRLRARGLGGGA